jgi:hypothetical protein
MYRRKVAGLKINNRKKKGAAMVCVYIGNIHSALISIFFVYIRLGK